jgi:hypothetical protein
MKHRLALCLLLGASACSLLHERGVVELSEERLAQARALGAETRAPVAFQRFGTARQHAERARPDSAERSDYTSEARLWLEVALAQAERARLSEQRLALEQESARLDTQLLALEQARLEQEDRRELSAAAEIARLEAERALARATAAPAQRVRLAPKELEQAARSLLTRAELIDLALPPAPDSAARRELRQLIDEARTLLLRTPERALALADRALFRALELLGALRAGTPEPSPESKASLLEALRLLGAKVSRTELGLSASLGGAGAESPRGLERLCSLVGAYPAGAVQLTLPRGRAAAAATPQAALPGGCSADRVTARHDPSSKGLDVVFMAY